MWGATALLLVALVSSTPGTCRSKPGTSASPSSHHTFAALAHRLASLLILSFPSIASALTLTLPPPVSYLPHTGASLHTTTRVLDARGGGGRLRKAPASEQQVRPPPHRLLWVGLRAAKALRCTRTSHRHRRKWNRERREWRRQLPHRTRHNMLPF